MKSLLIALVLQFIPEATIYPQLIISECSVTSGWGRGIEIRYIKVEDPTQKEITVDGKTYKLFSSRKSAIDYVTNQSIRKDYTIVYVMTDELKTTEVLEINN